MKNSEIESQKEILNVNSIDEIYSDIENQIDEQMNRLHEHLVECFQELNQRQKEGKRPTILQKNVLLRLHNDFNSLANKKKDIEHFRNHYKIFNDETSNQQ